MSASIHLSRTKSLPLNGRRSGSEHNETSLFNSRLLEFIVPCYPRRAFDFVVKKCARQLPKRVHKIDTNLLCHIFYAPNNRGSDAQNIVYHKLFWVYIHNIIRHYLYSEVMAHFVIFFSLPYFSWSFLSTSNKTDWTVQSFIWHAPHLSITWSRIRKTEMFINLFAA